MTIKVLAGQRRYDTTLPSVQAWMEREHARLSVRSKNRGSQATLSSKTIPTMPTPKLDTSAFDRLQNLIDVTQTNEGQKALRSWLAQQDEEDRKARLAIRLLGVFIVVGGISVAVYVGLVFAGIL